MGQVYAEFRRDDNGISAGSTNRTTKDNVTPIQAALVSDDINKVVRAALNQAFETQNLTWAELERRTGISDTTIRRIMLGEISSPPLDKVFTLYKSLNIPLKNILQTKDESNVSKTALHSLRDLVSSSAALLSHPNLPSQEDIQRTETLLLALAHANVFSLRHD